LPETQALGATWLDTQLAASGTDLGTLGFGADVRAALAVRAEFLIGEGLADRQDGQLRKGVRNWAVGGGVLRSSE
jgi:hypothetical protein